MFEKKCMKRNYYKLLYLFIYYLQSNDLLLYIALTKFISIHMEIVSYQAIAETVGFNRLII